MKNNSTLPNDGNLDEKGLEPGKIDMIIGKTDDRTLIVVNTELLSLVKRDIVLVRQLMQSDAESFAKIVELMPGLVRVGILASMKRIESLLAGEKNPSWEKDVDVSKLKSEVDNVVDVVKTVSTDIKDIGFAVEFGIDIKNILDKHKKV